MNEEAKYYRVGAFLIAGAVITVAAILVLGGGGLFRQEVMFETYLDESVQGLEVGSPVKLRGVKIGTVSEIGFVADYYGESDDSVTRRDSNYVVVRMRIVPRREDAFINPYRDRAESQQFLEAAIALGLRLQIASAGLTGTSFMQADYLDPERAEPLEIDWTPEHLYVPSAPSTFKQLSSAAERIVTRLEALDFETLVVNFNDLVATAQAKVEAVDVTGTQEEAKGLLADLRQTNEMIQGELDDSADTSALAQVERTVGELRALLASLRRSTDGAAYDLTTTLANLRVVSEELRDLSSNARAYPSHVLFGNPPPPAEHEGGD